VKKPKCNTCQGDKKVISATGDSRHPMQAGPCPECQPRLIVKVYRNLKHGKKAKPLYSVMHKGKVVARRHRVLLVNCKFVVNNAARLRVIQTKRKNVHAFVVGEWVRFPDSAFGMDEFSTKNLGLKMVYNPYKMSSFQTESGNNVKAAGGVLLNEGGITATYVDLYR
jgi:hypothetical protein